MEPARSMELIDRAMDVPIMNTNLVEEGNTKVGANETKKEGENELRLHTSWLKALLKELGHW